MLKKLQFTLLAVLFVAGTATAAFVAPPPANTFELDPAIAAMFASDGETITVEDFLALTPKEIREKTGDRLGLKKSLVLKMVQKSIRKQMKKEAKLGIAGEDAGGGDRNQLVAALLCFFLGSFGVHSFYLGQTGKGIAQIVLFLLGFVTIGIAWIALLIWTIVDLVRILTGNLTPKNGIYDPEL